jgi:DNA invertase Pin-like site-specific DNA recombinase
MGRYHHLPRAADADRSLRLAEFERDLIRTRTGEGRARAVARGVKMGRKPKMTPHQMKEALRRREAGEPMCDIAKDFNVPHSTISRLAV